MRRRLIRENLALALALLVLTPLAGVWAMKAWGVRQVLSAITGLLIIVGIWIVARDFDRRITREDDDEA